MIVTFYNLTRRSIVVCTRSRQGGIGRHRRCLGFVLDHLTVSSPLQKQSVVGTMSNEAETRSFLESDYSSLPNALRLQIQEEGQVEVSLLLEDVEMEPTQNSTPPTLPQKRKSSKQANDPIVLQLESNEMVETVPESVLQYERQLRKVQAEQRSVAEVSIEEHLRVVYEDSDIIVVDKPSGVLCVPGLYNKPNLLHLVCQHIAKENPAGEADIQVETKSDMIVHRLDMDTSGLVVFSKTPVALRALNAAFRDRTVAVKEYHALLCGHLPEDWQSGNIHLPLQRDHRHPPFMRVATPRSEAEAQRAVQDLQTHGFRKLVKKRPKPSHTEFRIVQREYIEFVSTGDSAKNPLLASDASATIPTEPNSQNKDADTTIRIPVTRVVLTPHTGRTHQLRVHCAALGFPIVFDPAYGLYGEAQARGGLDAPNEVAGSESSPQIEAPLALQQVLSTCRQSQESTMCLHAAKLGLKHPLSGADFLWTAPTPF